MFRSTMRQHPANLQSIVYKNKNICIFNKKIFGQLKKKHYLCTVKLKKSSQT